MARHLVSTVWISALLIVPVSALAQDPESPDTEAAPAEDDPVARARAAFARGIACVEEHETACAEREFRAALELHDAPAVRYNLASALYDLGRYPEAARLTASVIADEETPPEVRAHAETLRDQLRTDGATLAITLEGAADDVEVRADGEPVPASQLGELVVAPGNRVVTAHRDGAELARREVSARAGAHEAITLTLAPPAEEVAEQAPVEPAPGTPLQEEPLFWAAIGGGAAVVLTAIIVIAIAAATSGVQAPIEGNYSPGVLRW